LILRANKLGWELLAAKQSHVLPPGFFKRSFGMRNDRVIAELLGWTRDPKRVRHLSHRKEQIYRELIRHDRIVPLPGVFVWLNALRAARVPCAIASSTPRENIECVI
jgi:phosphoglycolate phosphatase-like HAD superfamily hydrolase